MSQPGTHESLLATRIGESLAPTSTTLDDEVHHPEECWVARVGLLMAVSSCDVPAFEDANRQLRDALQQDARVARVLPGRALDHEWCSAETVYPPLNLHSEEENSEPPSAAAHRHVIRFSSEITFELQIPQKNQPSWNPSSDGLPEQYLVKWDGSVAAIFWRQDLDSYVPLSAGRVVVEILRDAAEGAGLELLVQRCSRDCSFEMLHRTAKLVLDQNGSDDFLFEATDHRMEILGRASRYALDFDDVPEDFYSDVHVTANAFRDTKSLGQRLFDTEHYARDVLHSLLTLSYERASVGRSGLRRSIIRRWRMRGWRKRANSEIAAAWLAVTDLELLRHEWARLCRTFEDLASDGDLYLMFQGDHQKDASSVADIEVAALVSAVEQASSRLDTTAVVRATAWGALAGGTVGAVIAIVGAALRLG